jgi:hypothetical protein
MLGVGLPNRFPNLQSAIVGVKTHHLEELFISLESYWSIMFKMGSHRPFGHLKHQKKGQESNWQFNSWPLKVGNRPNFLVCMWLTTYCWKALDEGYNFALDLIMIRGLHRKLCALKVAGVPTVGISGLPLGSPGTKSHLDVALVESCRVYYKGEGGGFPQVWAVVSLVCPSLPVVRPSTKSVPTMH